MLDACRYASYKNYSYVPYSFYYVTSVWDYFFYAVYSLIYNDLITSFCSYSSDYSFADCF